MENLIIRKATIDDVRSIHKLVNHFAEKGLMLGRPLSKLYELVRDFFVATVDGELVGCAAVHIFWSDLVEIKSLAVAETYQRKGIGRALVGACTDETEALGVSKVFVLTYAEEFFRDMGFVDISKDELPHKVWVDCLECPKFPDCDERALVHDIG